MPKDPRPIFVSLYEHTNPHLAFSIDNSANRNKTMLAVYDDVSTLKEMREHFIRLTPREQRLFLTDFIKEKLTP